MGFTVLSALVRKDLQLFFRDRRAVIMSFAAPIAIASFFGAIFPGAHSANQAAPIPIHVVDEDGGAIAQSIVAGLREERTLATSGASAEQARDAVRRGESVLAVVIPKGFGEAAGKAFFTGVDKPKLGFLYDPSRGAELAMVRGILTQYVMQAVSQEVFSGPSGPQYAEELMKRLDTLGLPADEERALRDLLMATRNFYKRANRPGTRPASKQAGFSLPYSVGEEAVTARAASAYNGYAHAFAGMSVQFLLLAAIDLGVGILLERQRGLWKRLRSAPISRFALLGGKAASGTLMALMTLLISFAFAMLVFGVRVEGSVIGFFSVAIACALMASNFGLLIAALGRTSGATRGIAIFAVLVLTMLGGAWVPTFLFPAWLQRLTVFVPVRWAVDGLDAMTWRGIGLSGAVAPTLTLLGFGAVFGVLAVMLFRWDET